MKFRSYLHVLLAILLSTAIASCAHAPSNPVSLASFTENSVNVSVSLQHNSTGNDFLSATFTPPDGYHLYSKDIPASGVNGLGRPTVLALTPNSHMKALGGLTESVSAEVPDFGSDQLLVYPAGPVTLRLPVELPISTGWVNDEVRVSFVACSANQCKPPVEKLIAIRLPSADLFNDQ
ncbi:MAG TPA: hypothetical protein VK206_21660 [Anaerolineales bacterium]|nr:hypothetical protein [Anaerolineales bacterium]